jgi:hypothetical protein
VGSGLGSDKWGREREQLGRQALKDAQESLGGIREIEILGREDAFNETLSPRRACWRGRAAATAG